MGKSTTARFFAEAGAPVYDADRAVHRLYAGEAVPLVEAAFPGVSTAAGIDRDALAKRVLARDPKFVAQEENANDNGERQSATDVSQREAPCRNGVHLFVAGNFR